MRDIDASVREADAQARREFDAMRSATKAVAAEATEAVDAPPAVRSEEHTSELQSLMRNSYAVFCLHKQTTKQHQCHTLTVLRHTRYEKQTPDHKILKRT